jgi:hypothetical protein
MAKRKVNAAILRDIESAVDAMLNQLHDRHPDTDINHLDEPYH